MEIDELTERVEGVSARYAASLGFERTDEWYVLKLQEEVGELAQAFLMRQGRARAKGRDDAQLDAEFRAEIADVLCQTLLLARHHGVDLPSAVAEKWLVWESERC
ncbi:MazG nucleotide pyrophosphohydrolase domain-containing protein [Saccharopolyspora halophila]|uniref:MazG nucleotide pyrophosphohydrolase domain-containing protein n=1 Tax=Saccharopolyspora halophila TaxID=405551 RepID=A0ABN3GSL9_9PSEU